MASTTTSQALTRRPSDSTLMPPPPPKTKRIKRPAKVLDEETYNEALSHIIARDFFPGLLEAESQQDYLDALSSEDHEWIASARRKLTEVMTPGPGGRNLRGRRGTSMASSSSGSRLRGSAQETPKAWQADTPNSVASSETPSTGVHGKNQTPQVDTTNMSLSAFQAKYTSEDNESFYKLLDKQNRKRSEKYSWLWADNKIPAARQIAYRNKKKRLEESTNAISDLNKDKAIVPIESDDNRQAMPDTWRAAPENSLMFEPSSIEDSFQTVQQKAEETSRAPPKAVIYDNTRLPAPNDTSDSLEPPPSPPPSAIQDAIAGRARPTASEAGFSSTSTPRINGYDFVDPNEPSPSASAEPLPLTLFGSNDATPNPFKIKEESKREALHHRMVDKVVKGKRAKSQLEAAKTPVPRFMSSPRVSKEGLTPAGQRLLGTVGRGPTPMVGETPGLWEKKKRSRLREAWTPR
ncbi:MAG: hypothetical protein LQ342_000694 [Letrouitia transgressa]|nr:MAG: hypothetical protein LQ342_000694 [Letrouitia transgressa]